MSPRVIPPHKSMWAGLLFTFSLKLLSISSQCSVTAFISHSMDVMALLAICACYIYKSLRVCLAQMTMIQSVIKWVIKTNNKFYRQILQIKPMRVFPQRFSFLLQNLNTKVPLGKWLCWINNNTKAETIFLQNSQCIHLFPIYVKTLDRIGTITNQYL